MYIVYTYTLYYMLQNQQVIRFQCDIINHISRFFIINILLFIKISDTNDTILIIPF